MTSFCFWLGFVANVITIATAVFLLCRWLRRQQRRRRRQYAKNR